MRITRSDGYAKDGLGNCINDVKMLKRTLEAAVCQEKRELLTCILRK